MIFFFFYHALLTLINIVLMLIIMSMNGYIIIGVALGSISGKITKDFIENERDEGLNK